MSAEIPSNPDPEMGIEPFVNERHRNEVVSLWETVFAYTTPHNQPELAIDRKMEVRDGLFWVATAGGAVIGTTMAGYDGHRGWIYSVAVHPDWRKRGIGTLLVQHAELALTQRRCVKINLIILATNRAVTAFYASLGYLEEPVVSMGKRIPENIPLPPLP